MLTQLYIKNFALIDTLDMMFKPGFSVITGETGAGKSIILGAINLLLGQRADSKQIKKGCDKCIIEAHFDLSRYGMKPFFEENDIEFDAPDTILRRELTKTGKSRSFINDTPVPLSTMRLLGEQLIDIHSQHQNLMLAKEDFQLKVIDIIAHNDRQKTDYSKAFDRLANARKAVAKAKKDIEQSMENEEFYRFQHKELENANLASGIQEQLEAEQEKLSHVEDIKGSLYKADTMLCGNGDTGLLEMTREVAKELESLKEIYPDITEVAERMGNCYIELKDIAQDISADAEAIEYDPERLKQISDTLDTIYTLEQKHHTDSVDELIAIKDDLEQRLSNIDNSDDTLKMLQEEERKAESECREKARLLTETREKAARKVEQGMRERLMPLGIPNVKFAVKIEKKEFAADGSDAISFLFSANSSSDMMPVSQVASGGEIARVMLSLKAMISNAVKLPTIIFDEIDTGVSGKIAEKMAIIMQDMARTDRQVISITHLPQIAARGATHYRVFKDETESGTRSCMKMLSDEERVEEIAQMLSGADITDAALHNAKELIANCKADK